MDEKEEARMSMDGNVDAQFARMMADEWAESTDERMKENKQKVHIGERVVEMSEHDAFELAMELAKSFGWAGGMVTRYDAERVVEMHVGWSNETAASDTGKDQFFNLIKTTEAWRSTMDGPWKLLLLMSAALNELEYWGTDDDAMDQAWQWFQRCSMDEHQLTHLLTGDEPCDPDWRMNGGGYEGTVNDETTE
jgi:hypothetical protein